MAKNFIPASEAIARLVAKSGYTRQEAVAWLTERIRRRKIDHHFALADGTRMLVQVIPSPVYIEPPYMSEIGVLERIIERGYLCLPLIFDEWRERPDVLLMIAPFRLPVRKRPAAKSLTQHELELARAARDEHSELPRKDQKEQVDARVGRHLTRAQWRDLIAEKPRPQGPLPK
jgi:hypothetical protein